MGKAMRIWAGLQAIVLGLLVAGCDPAMAPSGNQVDASRAVTVGLLVPLGSGNAQTEQLAASLANAARLAQGDITGAEIDLRVYATLGTEVGAQTAATRAIAEGAKILIGPLFSTEAAAVRPVAASAGVAVISFSNNTTVAGGGVYVLGVTYESVAARLVDFAGARGLRNIAVVYPEGVDGASGRAAVQGAVARAGATFAGAAPYPLNVDGITSVSGGIAAQMRSAGANAIVFTDTPTGGLGFITTALRSAGLGASAFQFVGLTRWDASAEALAQPSLGGGWFALPDPALAGQFGTRYFAAFGTEPHDLSAIAYDSVAAVGAMLSAARISDDSAPFAAAKITDPSGFAGVNGIFRFRADGTNERGLAVMQVSGGVATVVDPAPRAFGGAES